MLLRLHHWLVGKMPPIDPLVDAFANDVEQRYSDSRNVTEYARRRGCSVRTLSRAARQARGRTPKEDIDDRVVLEAKRVWLTATIRSPRFPNGSHSASLLILRISFAARRGCRRVRSAPSPENDRFCDARSQCNGDLLTTVVSIYTNNALIRWTVGRGPYERQSYRRQPGNSRECEPPHSIQCCGKKLGCRRMPEALKSQRAGCALHALQAPPRRDSSAQHRRLAAAGSDEQR